MTQIETNERLAIGVEVVYTSRNGIAYKAHITQIREQHEHCDLRVSGMPGTSTTYQYAVPYDSDGQAHHSWRKRSDVPVTSEIHKERCPVKENTTFYFTIQGISYRCRHCKAIHVIEWPNILQEYAALCGTALPHD